MYAPHTPSHQLNLSPSLWQEYILDHEPRGRLVPPRQLPLWEMYSAEEKALAAGTSPVGSVWPAFLPMHTPNVPLPAQKDPAGVVASVEEEKSLSCPMPLDGETRELPAGHPSIGLTSMGFKCPFAKK